jgi:hypothetical protein
MRGEQFCANLGKLEVHDLDRERGSCRIDEILRAGHDRPYRSLDAAHRDGHGDCAWCLGSSPR